MNFTIASHLSTRGNTDLLVLPFWKNKKGHAEAATEFGKYQDYARRPISSEDFRGKEEEVLFLYVDEKQEKRVALLGLGDKEQINTEKLRRAFASLTKACRPKKIHSINVVLPDISGLTEEFIVRGICEGLLLSNYVFNELKGAIPKDDAPSLIKSVGLVGGTKLGLEQAKKCVKICAGVHFARNLVNGNADDVTAQYLAHVAKDLAKKLPHVKVTVLDKKQLEKEKMGLILAVNRASSHEPVLIVLEYRGAPKSKDHTVVVGKGVTYDTGGLNLKPTGSMETMKCDMSGAATALGTILVAATLGLKVNVTAVIPSVENCIGSLSYKPGDVYKSYLGKTVEISNTDAEGRLILADALAYANKKLKPTRIIDFATLTGAIDIALGPETIGLMSNHDALSDSLIRAGVATFERVWRLPMCEEYRDNLKSDIADIKSTGGRSAGSIIAAFFLKDFVGETPWAHLDIAAIAYLSEARRYHPKHGTGIGVRLMIEFLES